MKIVKRMDKKMCHANACPAIMKDEKGNIIIIGTDVTNEIENLSEYNAGCAAHERIVSIPQSVFDSIFNN